MKINSIINTTIKSIGSKKTTSTNPFEHNNFSGNAFKGSVLPFADVFQAIKPVEAPKPNKMKMIAGAVLSAVTDFKVRMGQPIALFAQKVREGIANGINRVRVARNTFREMGKNFQGRIAQMFDHKPNVADVNTPKVLNMRHITKDAPVQDLKATWIAENANVAKESGKAVA